jgi:hypothetical protein
MFADEFAQFVVFANGLKRESAHCIGRVEVIESSDWRDPVESGEAHLVLDELAEADVASVKEAVAVAFYVPRNQRKRSDLNLGYWSCPLGRSGNRGHWDRGHWDRGHWDRGHWFRGLLNVDQDGEGRGRLARHWP